MTALQSIIEKYLLLWLVLSSGMAFWLAEGENRALFQASAPVLPWMIGCTMLAIGWMLPTDEVTQVFRRWPTVLGGTAVQYIAMPGFAYLLVNVLDFERSIVIGMVMVGCVPGAMASNVLTLMARGNTSYSVSLTTMATLLSPIVVPLALYLTLGESVPARVFWESSKSLVITVVGPVVVGHSLSRLFPSTHAWAKILGSLVANLTILWIVAYVVAVNRQQLLTLQWAVVGACLALNIFGFVAGQTAATLMKLPESMRRALTLEVGMQNAGLGTMLVTQLFPGDAAVAIPTALYTFGCMMTGTVLAYLWGRSSEAALESPDERPMIT